MIQLGQLSLFVMAQLASRLPFQGVHVCPHWTYHFNSFWKKKKKNPRGVKRMGEGKKTEAAEEKNETKNAIITTLSP